MQPSPHISNSQAEKESQKQTKPDLDLMCRERMLSGQAQDFIDFNRAHKTSIEAKV